jgi:secondary thiamine-phosphate synthase enzyme
MKRFIIELATEGNNEIVNLNPELSKRLKAVTGEGLLHLFVPGSTAGLTTIEYEPGLVKHDLPAFLQRVVPDNIHYHHEATWHDDNGHSHVRSAMIGTSLTIPFGQGKLLTGEYQQIVLIDFDTGPRKRKVICTALP